MYRDCTPQGLVDVKILQEIWQQGHVMQSYESLSAIYENKDSCDSPSSARL